MDKEVLICKIDSLLGHIDLIFADTKGMTVDELKKASLLLRATCFSISQVGEIMNKLEKALSSKYDKLPWVEARRMRNAIVHDYQGIDVEQVYSTVKNDLSNLRTAFISIKNDLTNGELTTNRLILRTIKKEDTQAVFNNWASDPEVTKYLTWPTHKSIKDTERVMDRWLKENDDPKTIRYGIALKDSGELIGMIDVVSYIDNNPAIGYCLSRKYWNKGFMTEACNAFMEYLFAIGYQTILIEADENNIGSNKVIQKCGFEFTHKETKPCSSFKPEIITTNWYRKNK